MKKKLKEVFNKKELCCFFFDENDTNIFLIGWVVNYDAEFFILECITSSGFHNGFACRLIDSVIKIEVNSNYLQSIEQLFYFNNQKKLDKKIEEKECLKAFLEYAIEKHKVCFVELCESENLDAIGYIISVEKSKVSIDSVNECGKHDGELFLSFERISAVTLGNIEQIKLEKLFMFNKNGLTTNAQE